MINATTPAADALVLRVILSRIDRIVADLDGVSDALSDLATKSAVKNCWTL